MELDHNPSIAYSETNEPSIQKAIARQKIMINYIANSLIEGQDYGTVSGISKPFLFKSGAEKLCRLFGFTVDFEQTQSITDFDGKFFYFCYKCRLLRHKELVASAEGSCNSREKRYEKQQFKVYDLVNVVGKIAQKRALSSATLIATGASEVFEMEDIN